jgi:hypothetical protein
MMMRRFERGETSINKRDTKKPFVAPSYRCTSNKYAYFCGTVLEPHILHLKIGWVPSVIALHLLFVHLRLYVFLAITSTSLSLLFAKTTDVALKLEHNAVTKTTEPIIKVGTFIFNPYSKSSNHSPVIGYDTLRRITSIGKKFWTNIITHCQKSDHIVISNARLFAHTWSLGKGLPLSRVSLSFID